jgi:D-alanyl-D-alanine dipeptidase
MHQATKNLRHFVHFFRVRLRALATVGSGAARRMALAAVVMAGCLPGAAAQAPKLPAGFVYLRDIDPTIIQDMRYAGSNNFVGRPLRGYQAAECVVKREVGALLKSIQEELALQNLSLKMFDCYRPTRAVADMVAWSRDGKETVASKRFNPAFSKADLFRLGYIATHSGHSTGAALDLSLTDLKADNSATFDPARDYGDCTANVNLRAPDGSVDMGTGYDCTDVKSHTSAKSITADQRKWREKLVLLMRRRGFVNYSKEWWHFSLPGAGRPAYDFPIAPRK